METNGLAEKISRKNLKSLGIFKKHSAKIMLETI